MLEHRADLDLLASEFPEVWLFDQMAPEMEYNELKCRLFASCPNVISVQGGTAYFCPYFCEKLLVLHIEGQELACNSYAPDSFFYQLAPGPFELTISQSCEELVDAARSVFL
jgi:hypothetical protein